MCGIFGYLGEYESIEMYKWSLKIKHRGPDNTNIYSTKKLFLCFHRLSINGLNISGDQPMKIDNIILCCNGEIYNNKELETKNTTKSDCECIIHHYKKYGIEKTLKILDGEYSFILYDTDKNILYVARDHLGLRGLFYGLSDKGIGFSSESKSLGFCYKVEQFPPRTWWSSDTLKFNTYYEFDTSPLIDKPLNNINGNVPETEIIDLYHKLIHDILKESVKKRVEMSERPVGFLLSGGLDSSLCVALGSKYFKNPKDVNTFSIGLEGSPDLKYAKIVSEYLGTTHHEVIYNENDFLNEIPETIKAIESYDVTTVRASNGHRLISKYISENTNIKVLISGEVSDELTCGYMAFGAIENGNDLLEESIRMLSNIHFYDTLRSDRCLSYNGLEGRYPFASKDFVNLYLQIPGIYKTFYNSIRIEKDLLRKSFIGILPNEVLFRRKDGFSDGISSLYRTTHVIIKEYIDKQLTDEQFNIEKHKYKHCPPETKEELFYRNIFTSFYPDRDTLIPKPWRPNPKYYGNILEPSGRILSSFDK